MVPADHCEDKARLLDQVNFDLQSHTLSSHELDLFPHKIARNSSELQNELVS